MLIENDLLGICDAIKMIDENYFIVYSETKQKYEIHNRRDVPTYSLTVSYENLDFRTVELLYKSHISRLKEYFENLEKDNRNLEEQTKKELIEEITVQLEDSL